MNPIAVHTGHRLPRFAAAIGRNEARDEARAQHEAVAEAMQTEERDGGCDNSVRLGPYERPLKVEPGDSRPDDEADEGHHRRDGRIEPEYGVVHEDRGHRMGQAEERHDPAKDSP